MYTHAYSDGEGEREEQGQGNRTALNPKINPGHGCSGCERALRFLGKGKCARECCCGTAVGGVKVFKFSKK